MNLMDHPYLAQRNLIWSFLANLAAFPIFFLLLKFIITTGEFYDSLEFYIIVFSVLILTLFTTGFLFGYSVVEVIRFRRSSKNSRLHINSGIMSGYARSQEQSKNWFSWLSATAVGVSNLTAFYLLFEALKKLL